MSDEPMLDVTYKVPLSVCRKSAEVMDILRQADFEWSEATVAQAEAYREWAADRAE